MIPTPLPIDPVGFDPATATEEEVRNTLRRCSDRRDLWDDEHVETSCGQVITLPWGIERRPTTCLDCLAGEPS